MYDYKLGGVVPSGSAASLTSTGTGVASVVALAKLQIKRYGFLITTATVSTGNIVLKVYQRTNPGNTVGQTQVGQIIIPGGVAVGNVYYEEFSGSGNLIAKLLPGQVLEVDVTTAAAGGGAAGAGIFIPEEIEESPDVVANYSNHVLG